MLFSRCYSRAGEISFGIWGNVVVHLEVANYGARHKVSAIGLKALVHCDRDSRSKASQATLV